MKSLRLVAAIGAVISLLAVVGTGAHAQDSTRSVTLTFLYNSAETRVMAVMPVSGPLGDSVRTILERDLTHSDQFRMVPLTGDDRTIYHPAGALLNYAMFAGLGVRMVVEPQVTATGIHVRVHLVDSANVIFMKDWLVTEAGLSREWRMRLHGISDSIQAIATGTRGIAATRISYDRNNSIHLIDSDGAGDVALPVDTNALATAWHPSGTRLVYNTIGDSSRIFTIDLTTGHSKLIVPYHINAANSGPVYAPDGGSVYFSQSLPDGDADIFRASESEGWTLHRLTNRSGTNIMPSVNPSGNRLAFCTDRTGHPEIYTMDMDGTDLDPIPSWRDESRDYEPTWSPDGGTKLAYISEVGGLGQNQLFVRNMLDQTVMRVTSEGVNQQPSWAPDGRHLVFQSNRTGRTELYVLDLESKAVRQLTVSGAAKLPSWSPRLVR